MRFKLLLAGTCAAVLCFAAWGQNVQPTRVVGTVKSLMGDTLVVQTAGGRDVTVALPPDAKIVANTKGSLADIHQNDFVGSAAVKGPDGKLHAQEVHIFPADMRGTGEGHRPMGPDPNRTMTNGSVSIDRTMTNGNVSSVSGSGQRMIVVNYKGGEQKIEVAPSTPVILIVPASRSLLKPGSAVSVFATKTSSGLSARMVTAEKDGVKPQL